MTDLPSDAYLTRLAKRIVLQPRQFGVMGSYSRELLDASVMDSMSFAMDQLAVRLVTSVLSGRTISAEPTVEVKYPASWWQHLKHAVGKWHERKDGELLYFARKHRPLRLWALIPVIRLLGRQLKRHPARYSTLTGTLNIEQSVLYPEIDAPPNAGRPVIYETVSFTPSWEPNAELWSARLREDPSRFLSKPEIISAVRRDPELFGAYRGDEVWAMVEWLEKHGVNIEQLVKRQGF